MILQAAAQVFQREGMAATTNRIAARAGFSIGTLYQYFPNKQALLYALAERHIASVRTELGRTFAALRREEPSWEQTVRTLVRCVVELHRDNTRLHHLMQDYTPRLPQGVAQLAALRAEVTSELTFHLHRCRRGGGDPERVAALLVHTADAQLHGVLLGAPDAEEELIRSLLAMT